MSRIFESPLGFLLLSVGLTLASCATTARKPEVANQRVKDTPADKVAAHRAAAPRSLELEKDEDRWPTEAARERKRAREAEDAAKARPGNPTTTTDVVEPNPSR